MVSFPQTVITFDKPLCLAIFRMPPTSPSLDGLPIGIFMGAILRPHYCMRPLKLQNLALWTIGRLTIEHQEEALYPQPPQQRAPNELIRLNGS